MGAAAADPQLKDRPFAVPAVHSGPEDVIISLRHKALDVLRAEDRRKRVENRHAAGEAPDTAQAEAERAAWRETVSSSSTCPVKSAPCVPHQRPIVRA